MNEKKRKILLIIGPESSGTRIFTDILSQHPKILGTKNASTHIDILDDFWDFIEKNEIKKAVKIFPNFDDYEYILTRRSMPHGQKVNEAAKYMKFPNLKGFYQVCKLMNFKLLILITTRSVVANLLSWTHQRASAEGSFKKASIQYREAYKFLFSFINQNNIPFYFVSLEAFILDTHDYLNSIFQLIDLSNIKMEIKERRDVNEKRYFSFFKGNLDKPKSLKKDIFNYFKFKFYKILK